MKLFQRLVGQPPDYCTLPRGRDIKANRINSDHGEFCKYKVSKSPNGKYEIATITMRRTTWLNSDNRDQLTVRLLYEANMMNER